MSLCFKSVAITYLFVNYVNKKKNDLNGMTDTFQQLKENQQRVNNDIFRFQSIEFVIYKVLVYIGNFAVCVYNFGQIRIEKPLGIVVDDDVILERNYKRKL